MTQAYWISPDGAIYDVPGTHISFIAANLQLFGISNEQYQAVYQKHGESLDTVGKAVKEIMAIVFGKSWMKIQFVEGKGWILEMCYIGDNEKKYVLDWSQKVTGDASFVMNEPINNMSVREIIIDKNFVTETVREYRTRVSDAGEIN